MPADMTGDRLAEVVMDQKSVEYAARMEGSVFALSRTLAKDWLALWATVSSLEAERDRLREFAERMIDSCEWGPCAISDDEEEIWDASLRLGIIKEHPHAQPCRNDDCHCEGGDTLVYFAWRPPPQGGDNG